MTKSKSLFKDADDLAYRELVTIANELYGYRVGWRVARLLWNQWQHMPENC